ncbi:MAG: DUF1700 domain-containing protein [Tissierellia bacterium]|nr:DUF1700 domain-containing protein [Tissierellia bacterium]
MKREEYLDLLRYYLRDLPLGIIHDIISDYDNHFIEAMASGRREEDIAKELGSPKEIAEEYLKNEKFRRSRESTNTESEYFNENHTKSLFNPKRILKILLTLIAIIILGPIAFAVLITILATVAFLSIALFIVVFAIFVLGISMIFPGIIGSGIIASLNPVTRTCFALGIIGISLILFNLVYRLTRFIFRALKKELQMIRWRFGKWRRRK